MFKDLRVGILRIFADAQAPARAITTEMEGNVRASYLMAKREDNAERWKDIASNKAKRDARNAKRRARYVPKPKRPEPTPEELKAKRRAKYARLKDKLNADKRAKYDPKARSDRHKRTGH
jgi:hypothetical protein